MFWVLMFYAFVAVLGGILWFMLNLSHPKYRNEEGDIISEVGYEEDSIGRRLVGPDPDSLGASDVPHGVAAGGAHSGMV
jgi:hypothetical protein